MTLPTTIENWQQLEPHFQELATRNIPDKAALLQWLKDRSDLESTISEDLAWRYIRMTCDTENKTLENSYLTFVSEIQPEIAPWEDQLNRKLNDCPYTAALNDDPAYHIYFRSIKKDIELYREENIPLYVTIQTDAQKYGAINGAMSVQLDGQELTLQQAANHLKSTEREKRKTAFEAIQQRRYADKDTLNQLLDDLIANRHQVALNAGFSNFRDYMHTSLGRFDYSVEDCFAFHDAIEKIVVPMNKALTERRKQQLGLGELKPWDTEVDVSGKEPLHPFTNGEDLAQKTIHAFGRLDPLFAEVISTMKQKKQLDLDSRKGKAPGGYNYPLAVTGYPFIFMNAASSLRDLETMVHEGGHAIHSVLTKDLPLNAFKECPSEVAELASMSMELISMNVWDEFLSSEEELKRARTEQLEGVIKTLPWIATIDAFQHWLYTNPQHTTEERTAAWEQVSTRFGTGIVDWEGYEDFRANAWQKQLHIFEVPFYYIEYGFAQLGAIGVWKNFKSNNTRGLQQYKEALSLGYTRSIPEIYATAGARFDFSPAYVKELFDFVQSEL